MDELPYGYAVHAGWFHTHGVCYPAVLRWVWTYAGDDRRSMSDRTYGTRHRAVIAANQANKESEDGKLSNPGAGRGAECPTQSREGARGPGGRVRQSPRVRKPVHA